MEENIEPQTSGDPPVREEAASSDQPEAEKLLAEEPAEVAVEDGDDADTASRQAEFAVDGAGADTGVRKAGGAAEIGVADTGLKEADDAADVGGADRGLKEADDAADVGGADKGLKEAADAADVRGADTGLKEAADAADVRGADRGLKEADDAADVGGADKGLKEAADAADVRGADTGLKEAADAADVRGADRGLKEADDAADVGGADKGLKEAADAADVRGADTGLKEADGAADVVGADTNLSGAEVASTADALKESDEVPQEEPAAVDEKREQASSKRDTTTESSTSDPSTPLEGADSRSSDSTDRSAGIPRQDTAQRSPHPAEPPTPLPPRATSGFDEGELPESQELSDGGIEPEPRGSELPRAAVRDDSLLKLRVATREVRKSNEAYVEERNGRTGSSPPALPVDSRGVCQNGDGPAAWRAGAASHATWNKFVARAAGDLAEHELLLLAPETMRAMLYKYCMTPDEMATIMVFHAALQKLRPPALSHADRAGTPPKTVPGLTDSTYQATSLRAYQQMQRLREIEDRRRRSGKPLVAAPKRSASPAAARKTPPRRQPAKKKSASSGGAERPAKAEKAEPEAAGPKRKVKGASERLYPAIFYAPRQVLEAEGVLLPAADYGPPYKPPMVMGAGSSLLSPDPKAESPSRARFARPEWDSTVKIKREESPVRYTPVHHMMGEFRTFTPPPDRAPFKLSFQPQTPGLDPHTPRRLAVHQSPSTAYGAGSHPGASTLSSRAARKS
ncbi:hypothetical protein DIPPA_23483 [Diplonema papillatum]|nr:hypothetical protein DIPPA_23483 [Diplonema papillatum]